MLHAGFLVQATVVMIINYACSTYILQATVQRTFFLVRKKYTCKSKTAALSLNKYCHPKTHVTCWEFTVINMCEAMSFDNSGLKRVTISSKILSL